MTTPAVPSLVAAPVEVGSDLRRARRRLSASRSSRGRQISITVAAIFFGAYLLVTGIQQVIFAFSLHVSAGGRVLLFISGAASLILAVLAFRHLYDAVLLMAIWIAVGFIFRGVATTVSAISDPTLPGRGWNIFVGVISLIAGVVVLASPFESIGDPGVGRRHLADRHRRDGGRGGVRHPQASTKNRRPIPQQPA